MGQYYRFINLDKKQRCDRNKSFLKLTEHSYLKNEYCMDILSLLNNEWKGDRIIHVGDYAEGNDGTTTDKIIKQIEQDNNLDKTVYHWGDSLEDISPSKKQNNIRYVYNIDKKEFIDLVKQPIQWFHYENNKIYSTKYNTFALLVGCGNEQGGGDYYYKNKKRIGMWAGNRFEASPVIIKEYSEFNEVKYVFNELLPIKNRIRNINEDTEKRIFFDEGVELKHFLNRYKDCENIDLHKVELDKECLTEREFKYLNCILNKYKTREFNKEKLNSQQENRNQDFQENSIDKDDMELEF